MVTVSEVDAFITQNKADILQFIGELVTVKSVCGQKNTGQPFGKDIRTALDIMLAKAQKLGLATKNEQGLFGFAEIEGEVQDYIAMLTHLDVVPPGEGWSGDPYLMRQKDDWLIGRGVKDDKGPAVLTLYALLFFKNRSLRFGIRSIFGCDEETSMRDIQYYNKIYSPPLFAFTPDGDFPVNYGEKSIIQGGFRCRTKSRTIKEIFGGEAFNVIPQTAFAVVSSEKTLLPAPGITIETGRQTTKITATGIGGHSAYPKGTKNAIALLLKYIDINNICSGEEGSAVKFLCRIHSDYYGEGIGIDAKTEYFSPLTAAGTQISLKDGYIIQGLNIRSPYGLCEEQIVEFLSETADNNGFDYNLDDINKGYLCISDSLPIKILQDTYNQCAQKSDMPKTSSGGTYARKLQNCVSFGIARNDDEFPDFIGTIHGRDEGVSIERLMLSLKVYILSLARLQELPI